jgi:uncharacterized membrane protein
MTLDAVIMLVGAFIAVTPLLGFTQEWDKVIAFMLGALVVALGIVVRRRGARISRPVMAPKKTAAYVETAPRTDEHVEEQE